MKMNCIVCEHRYEASDQECERCGYVFTYVYARTTTCNTTVSAGQSDTKNILQGLDVLEGRLEPYGDNRLRLRESIDLYIKRNRVVSGTVTDMRQILSHIREDVHLAPLYSHYYWQTPMVLLSLGDRHRLILNFAKTQDALSKIHKRFKMQRSNSLNIQFRLYQELLAIGKRIDKSYFKLPSTDESIRYHTTIWGVVSDMLDQEWDANWFTVG
jgi:hypothetical protein